MNVDRELLLAAVKAASKVTGAVENATIPMFSKVWLLSDKVFAVDTSGLTLTIPIKLADLGGFDGKLLSSLLESLNAEDSVSFSKPVDGRVTVTQGKSVTVLESAAIPSYILTLPLKPKFGAGKFSLPIEDVFESIQLNAMLDLKLLKNEPATEFGSMIFSGASGKLTLFTSDRMCINRTKPTGWKGLDLDATMRLVPLTFLRTLEKFKEFFEGGELTCDENHIAVVGEEGTELYSKLSVPSPTPIDFGAAIRKLWPDGKINTGLLVEVPEQLLEAVNRAALFINKKDGKSEIRFDVEDGELKVSYRGLRGSTEEVMPFNHPDGNIKVNSVYLRKALKLCDRMYIGRYGISLFGEAGFSRFIAGTSA